MDRRIRILAFILVGCFLALFLQLNNFQVRMSSALKNSPYEASAAPHPFAQPRGDIVTSDGFIIAKSTPSKDAYKEQRAYPLGSLFGNITGYYDAVDQAAPYGIEAEYDSYLTYHQSTLPGLAGVLTTTSGTDSVVLTISDKLQAVAAAAIAAGCPGEPGGCQEGAGVVAFDPQNGNILAMYGTPTYDPNVLSSHDAAAVHKAYTALSNPTAGPYRKGGEGNSPLINFPTQQTIAPGSTMKVITTSAMFDHDLSLTTKTWPYLTSTPIPQTSSMLSNFAGESCGGSLVQIIEKSCDTAYALIGLKLGAQNLVNEAQAFGFNSQPPLDLPSSEVSAAVIPSAAALNAEVPFIAYSAIGQGNVKQSALTDALVVGAIGDNGKIMAPHLMSSVVSQTGQIVETYKPHVWKTATTPETAAQVRALMRGVANVGTAAGVFPAGLHIAAKTGTAETGSTGCSANWMVATGPADPGDTPSVAVAAVIPYQPGLSCGDTGATVAGPIVAKVIEAAIAMQKGA